MMERLVMFEGAMAEDRRNPDVGGPKRKVPGSTPGAACPVVRRCQEYCGPISGVIAREMGCSEIDKTKATGRSIKHHAV
jgi:hypothetical protein